VHIVSDKKYWSYEVAFESLQKRLQATNEEVDVWTYIGHADGGIDAFDKPHDNQSDLPTKKRHFTNSPLGAYFLREQIESFNPDDSRRYLTLQELTDRWVEHYKPDKLVQEYVATARLEPINVLRGHSEQVIDAQAGEGALIHDLSLFELAQVREIEVADFSAVAVNTDSSLWATKSSVLEAFRNYGLTEKKINNGGAQWILDARRMVGSGGRGHVKEPMFCPFALMQGLVNHARPKLNERRGWKILEDSFPAVYKKYSAKDPRQYDV